MKIGTGKRLDIVDKSSVLIPGPGLYDDELNIIGKGSRAVSIRGKPVRDDKTISPGPGAYMPDPAIVKSHNGSTRIGSADRKSYFQTIGNKTADLPGPAQYNEIELNEGKAYKFDKSERKLNINDTPGPGHYKVNCMIADVPKYALPN